ncbi:hypothetical protein, partial [Psychromonas sp. MB-3u-54]|uniref:hypothetical protein n=1 Tax=Psychromonas sp. MB-3u-54 TaxID=2058319 RepID=UPI001E46F313
MEQDSQSSSAREPRLSPDYPGHAELSPLMTLCFRKIRPDYHMKGNVFDILSTFPMFELVIA